MVQLRVLPLSQLITGGKVAQGEIMFKRTLSSLPLTTCGAESCILGAHVAEGIPQ
jgi:hypothetical protein